MKSNVTTKVSRRFNIKKLIKNNEPPMGKTKFQQINWRIGDTVKLTNQKLYKVVSLDVTHNSLVLHSAEYNSDFKADCRIIVKRIN